MARDAYWRGSADRPLYDRITFSCGISSDLRVLVACRILQGCGGAMMVPVGRLTMVRAFAKSELVRAMSFVAIPSLIGPMLGPLAGGFIVGFFHWRVIFFVNLPIGLLGLYLVYRHLPDYRAERSDTLDLMPGSSSSARESLSSRKSSRSSASTRSAAAKSWGSSPSR